jgi:hypothetical protein
MSMKPSGYSFIGSLAENAGAPRARSNRQWPKR